jgi:hypothetical protein
MNAPVIAAGAEQQTGNFGNMKNKMERFAANASGPPMALVLLPAEGENRGVVSPHGLKAPMGMADRPA